MQQKNIYKISARVWEYPGMAGWHFVSLPKEQSADIDKRFKEFKKGWGSLPVSVTVGKTSWTTSIFPDKKSQTYLLPLKSAVRKKEGILKGAVISLTIKISV